MGRWAVQETEGYFKAVAPDMAQEQRLQRVSKGPGGHYVVGESRKPDAVAEFELLFHEVGDIAHILGVLTMESSCSHREHHLQSCFSKSRRVTLNKNVFRLLQFISAKQNPYKVALSATAVVPLHNILNQQVVHPIIAEQILNCLKAGEKARLEFRKER